MRLQKGKMWGSICVRTSGFFTLGCKTSTRPSAGWLSKGLGVQEGVEAGGGQRSGYQVPWAPAEQLRLSSRHHKASKGPRTNGGTSSFPVCGERDEREARLWSRNCLHRTNATKSFQTQLRVFFLLGRVRVSEYHVKMSH